MKIIFCADLPEEYEKIYEELKTLNPEWLIQQQLVSLGFKTLIEMEEEGILE